ncbi:MAG: hypothetical protein ACRDWT_05585 [Jatrophihabitantaceae bacterium]
MPDEREPDSPDDVLDLRRRRIPRWAVVVLWAVVVAVAVTVLVNRAGSTKPDAGPTPGSSGPVLSEPLGGPVSADLQIGNDRLLQLSHGALYRWVIGAHGALTADGVVGIAALDLTIRNATDHLIVDAAAHRLWLVTYGASPATVIEFDAWTLGEVGRLLWPSEVHAAAAMGGHLYLAAVNAVVDIASATTAPRTIDALTGQYTAIAADPVRSRLLLLDDTQGTQLVTYTPSSGRVSGGVHVFDKLMLQVAGGQIWVSGWSDQHAALARLDPRTLRPVTFSELSAQLTNGAILVSGGDHVLWVRAANDDYGLWCLDASSGNQLQYWQYAGAVASRRGAAYVAQRDGPLALHLSACGG